MTKALAGVGRKIPGLQEEEEEVEEGSGRGTYLLLWLGWRVGRQEKRHTAEEKLMIKCGVVYKHIASEKGE